MDKDVTVDFRPLCLLALIGVAVRACLMLLGGSDVELQSDEANYAYLAISWSHFGVYLDHHRYLWPPGYSWVMAQMVDLFGAGALTAMKWLQVVLSASIGMTTMLFAHRLGGGMKAAKVAGVIWILYLPLAAFTHMLWNESLFLAMFLPALYQVLRLAQGADDRVQLRLVAAGLLFAGALYFKEAPTYLVPALALLLVPFSGGIVEGVRRASLMIGVVFVCALPWCMRNLEVYGHFTFADSMGENFFNGINEEYRNFDLIPLDAARNKRGMGKIELGALGTTLTEVEKDSGWLREERLTFKEDELVNTIERSRAMRESGLAYMGEHKGWFVRSRVQKLADLVTPFSFFTRHQALGHYDDAFLGGPVIRKLTSLWAIGCTVLMLLLGTAGLLSLNDRRAQLTVGLVCGYTVATTMLVAMSRFRMPIIPLLIAAAAVLLVRPGVASRAKSAGTLCLWGALVFLWVVNWPVVSSVFQEMIWRADA